MYYSPQVLNISYLRRNKFPGPVTPELFDDPAAWDTALSTEHLRDPPFEGHLQAHQQQRIILTKKSVRE